MLNLEREARFRSLRDDGAVPSFGHDIRKEFALDFDGGNNVFCNQGSYGVSPKRILDYKFALFTENESAPDHYHRIKERATYDRALASVADFLGSDLGNIVFVPNATNGVNAVLKSIDLKPGDKVLQNHHTYQAVRYTVAHVAEDNETEFVTLDLPMPIESEDQIIQLYKQTCESDRSIRLVVLDYISSPSAILFPVARVARELHALGVLVLVDGAHAPGHAPDLALEELGRSGVDFFAGNLHKWAFAPRGCAVLWVHPRHHNTVVPLTTSHNFKKSFQDQFFLQGTLDSTNYVCAEAAMDFYRCVGGRAAIAAYVEPLLEWAQAMLAAALGTHRMPVPKTMEAPFMKVVALPTSTKDGSAATIALADRKTIELLSGHRVCVNITAFHDVFWMRISGSVWSTKQDYERLRDALLHYFELK